MEDSFSTLDHLIEYTQSEWHKFDSGELSRKPSPNKWSKKEILGHLIDSAINNIARLIKGQIETLEIQEYRQNEWVESQNYQNYDEDDLIHAWSSLNHHLLNAVRNIKGNTWEKECLLSDGRHVTLRWLFYDYLAHMKHHLRQIFGEREEL